MSKVVNQTELAEILGKDDTTIWEWQKLEPPLPVLKRGVRGASNEYDLAAVIEWYIEREVLKRTPNSPRDQRDAVELELKQLDLDQRKGVLIPAADVKPLWNGRVLTAAAFMAARHSRLAALLEATPGIEAKRALLKKEDASFLTKLGVEGERMQQELDALLARLVAEDVSEFLRKIAGDDYKQSTAGSIG